MGTPGCKGVACVHLIHPKPLLCGVLPPLRCIEMRGASASGLRVVGYAPSATSPVTVGKACSY